MARRKNVDPRMTWHIYIPSTIAAQVELILLDPFLQKARFGAKSELVTALLQEWLDKQKPAQLSAFDTTYDEEGGQQGWVDAAKEKTNP